jgi:hypothetical protein
VEGARTGDRRAGHPPAPPASATEPAWTSTATTISCGTPHPIQIGRIGDAADGLAEASWVTFIFPGMAVLFPPARRAGAPALITAASATAGIISRLAAGVVVDGAAAAAPATPCRSYGSASCSPSVACCSPPSSTPTPTPTATASSGNRTVRHRARSLRSHLDRGAAGSWRRRAGVADGGEHLQQDEESGWPRPQRARRPEGVLPPPCTGCGTSASPPLALALVRVGFTSRAQCRYDRGPRASRERWRAARWAWPVQSMR